MRNIQRVTREREREERGDGFDAPVNRALVVPFYRLFHPSLLLHSHTHTHTHCLSLSLALASALTHCLPLHDSPFPLSLSSSPPPSLSLSLILAPHSLSQSVLSLPLSVLPFTLLC